MEDAEVALYAYGAVARSAPAAGEPAPPPGKRGGLFRPRSIWPFLDEPVAALSERVDRIVVAEMNLGQLVGEVQRTVAGRCRVDLFSKVGGEPIHPDELYDYVSGGA